MAIRHIKLDNKNFDISYILLDNKQKDWILILHGWGASKELMYNAFRASFKLYNHIYIDLPGFGNSSNNFILDSKLYAKVIKAFLDSINITPKAILGHSFGGKISLLLNPRILILLSSSGLVKEKSLKVKLKIKLAKIANLFGLNINSLRSKDALNLSKTMYETFKIVVNEDFSKEFSEYQNQAFIFWGRDDDITPLYLGEKMKFLIRNSELYVFNGGHFFFLENTNNIDRIFNGK
ncbi:alpha/beta fold hydrolase [Helicobacter sp. MIT 14-3879]|uniref:alpha/beta fold hydrolase n=1 Tax=Helicobacter sp. MIT 14-3879 TaxID=2040649 RepID=UPI000E1F1451|nr:alpha/beta fold hydrolase [Helicobacter sp. MIT 14-3879]RDU65472.1 alpha/beta hydrolase [Helicobacter sp. MIT 14-3879]